MLDIIGIGYLAHLSVADDIDARVHLTFYNVIDRAGYDGIQGGLIFQLAIVPRKDPIGYGL